MSNGRIYNLLSIPLKRSVSYAISILKGKSLFQIKKKNKKIPKGSYWVRGYYVSKLGITEVVIRKYIEN